MGTLNVGGGFQIGKMGRFEKEKYSRKGPREERGMRESLPYLPINNHLSTT